MTNTLRNEYYLLRHGRSLANEAEIIISKPENGVLDRWTLAPAGEEQAKAAGRKLGEWLRQASAAAPARPTLVYSSPFSRTLRTAALATEAAGLQGVQVQVANELRERFFGDALELQPYGVAYGKLWAADALDPESHPGENGESVEEVAARVRQLFQRIEAEHAGAAVLLVSHGDTLSILQASMTGADAAHHHALCAFDTAELRRLADVPQRGAGDASTAGGH